MDPITAKLYKKYQSLPQAEQQILQVLSVIFEPLRQGMFQTILKDLAWRDDRTKDMLNGKGELLSSLMSKPLREELLILDIISYEKNHLQCNQRIIELVTRETVKNDTFNTILKAVRKELLSLEEIKKQKPKLGYLAFQYHYDEFIKSRPLYIEAQLRHAIYEDDEKTIREILKPTKINSIGISTQYKIQSVTSFCERLVKTDENLFFELPDSIKLFVLSHHAQENIYYLSDEWMVKLLPKTVSSLTTQDEVAVALLAELYLLQGRMDEAEHLLTNNNSWQALAIKAWLVILQGNAEQSLLLYEVAIEAIKKTTRKRNIYIPGLAGIFHIIALLTTHDNADKEHALLKMKYYRAGESKTPFMGTMNQLEESFDLLQGAIHYDDSFFLGKKLISETPLTSLLHALQLVWTNKTIDSTLISHLINGHEQAIKTGYDWLAWQVEHILLLLNDKSPTDQISQALITLKSEKLEKPEKLNGLDSYSDLTQLIASRESWEIALDALEDVGLPEKSTSNNRAASTNNDTRMTWRLSKFFYTPEPREQKLSRNGKWTKGRKVALKKLYSERENYDYLTEQDQRICNQIQEHSYYEYGYHRTDYELEASRALLAAVGHPLVFTEDNLITPMELVKEEPCLVIKEISHGQSLHLQLSPYSINKIAIKEESAHKLSIVEYTPQHQQIAEILGEKGITVPKKAKKQVMDRIATLAPLLTIHSDIAGSNTNIKTVKAKQTLHFHLQPIDGGLKLSAFIQPFTSDQPLFHPGEGGATVFAEVDKKQVQTQRNLKAEKKTINQLLQQCPALYQNSQYEWLLDDPETALDTLLQLQELQLAQPHHIKLEWPQGKKITLNNAAELSQMSVQIGKSQDWFSVSGELQVSDGQVLEMRHLMNLLAQSSGRFIQLGENQFLALTEELRNRLDAIRAYTSGKNGKFHALAIPAVDDLVEGMQVKASKPWKDQLKRLQESRDVTLTVPTTLQAELRDYQQEGFQWLARLAYWGAGACLADDMGLGKTMQALALILTRSKQGPTLILAPTSVCSNWETESYRFSPTLNVKRFGTGNRQKMLDNAGAFDLIICSYGLLQSESERLAEVKWQTIVADEAQAIKNHQAKRTKAAMKLQANFRMITTGTPIENHLGELWSLFNFINPGLLGSLESFNSRYALPIERDNNHQARQQLKKLISPFILRRLKSEVLTELPPRTEITLSIELSAEEIALYEAMRQQAVENVAQVAEPGQKRFKILAEIMRLRRVCCHPRLVMPDSPIASSKLEAFKEIVEELRTNHHKALVFSQFVGHLALIREYLDRQDIEYQYLDGSTPVKKRQQAVTDFQAGEGELFLISLKAGGSGLNLTAADYVIHLDPWWNPAVEDQASDRAHRIGQKRPVTIYRLVAKDTIEEKIVGLHNQKRDLADSLLEGTEMSGKLSVDDILLLLKDK